MCTTDLRMLDKKESNTPSKLASVSMFRLTGQNMAPILPNLQILKRFCTLMWWMNWTGNRLKEHTAKPCVNETATFKTTALCDTLVYDFEKGGLNLFWGWTTVGEALHFLKSFSLNWWNLGLILCDCWKTSHKCVNRFEFVTSEAGDDFESYEGLYGEDVIWRKLGVCTGVSL